MPKNAEERTGETMPGQYICIVIHIDGTLAILTWYEHDLSLASRQT